MSRVLPGSFFYRPTLVIARSLLGKFLVVRHKDGTVSAQMITEVEAYDGPHDRASHASRGKTERTRVMFGPAGRWYVYLIYGMYWMLNVVTGPEEYPAAILIRGIDGQAGPGKLTNALGIDRRFNGASATRATGLWIEDRGVSPMTSRIKRTPRIGVDYAGPVWARKLYRFVLVESRRRKAR